MSEVGLNQPPGLDSTWQYIHTSALVMLFIQKYVNHTTLWLVQIPWSYIPEVASTPGSASTLMSFTKPSSTTSPFFLSLEDHFGGCQRSQKSSSHKRLIFLQK
jgi:hypothetical protein